MSLSQPPLLKSHSDSEHRFPLVIEPEVTELNLVAWASSAREMLEAELLRYGAILFRNFDLDTVTDFEQFARTISPHLLDYRERSSQRSEVKRGIYTSTEHPPDQFIHFHNEQSYARSWPMKLWFFCLTPPDKKGATPIADGRRVLRLLDPKIKERFLEKQVLYVRNYHKGIGLPWEVSFQTRERAEVEDYCRKASIDFEWKDRNGLRTRQIFKTIAPHPRTGEMVWFEHTAFFHISSLEPSIRNSLQAEFREEDLPFNTYYGDGSPIEDSVLEAIREAYRKVEVTFPWKKGELLLIDNMLVSHGREPYTGPRKILVAMAELYRPPDN
jgi:alpha-ketoglutarate-dependent taurine dioxygenase